MNRLRIVAITTTLLLCGVSSDSLAAPVDGNAVWDSIRKGDCQGARARVEASDERGTFLDTPEGDSLYGKSICCCSPSTLDESDLDIAIAHLDEALSQFDPLEPGVGLWLEDAKLQCEERRLEVASVIVAEENAHRARSAQIVVTSEYSGKILGRCKEGFVSSRLVPSAEEEKPGWTPIMPNRGDWSTAPQPPPELIEHAKAAHVNENPDVEVCLPFVAISSIGRAKDVCRAAKEFSDFFRSRYRSKAIPVWITLHHYPPDSDALRRHVAKSHVNIRCGGVLGYFDWRMQSLAYRSPAGFFGTFRHELAHALLFWDMPLAPAWFDEGLAGLYENTTSPGDREFVGIANPWREAVLAGKNITTVRLEDLEKTALSPSSFEFDQDPLGSTVSREFLRGVQDEGDLPALYDCVRRWARSPEALEAAHLSPFDETSSDVRSSWRAIAASGLPAGECPIAGPPPSKASDATPSAP